MKLSICICGWYFYPELLKLVAGLPADEYNSMVVSHSHGNTHGVDSVMRDNQGLEFGAYSYFVDNVWDHISNVLFIHDDIDVRPSFFQRASEIKYDQAYVFENEDDYRQNLAHGRVIFATASFLEHVRNSGGIWYDRGNRGFIAKGNSWTEKPPAGCKDHNAGIRAFMALANEIGKREKMQVNMPVYMNDVTLGRRGKLTTKAGQQGGSPEAKGDSDL
jgi:hypothetical protein